jgi:hypothetical protein
MFCTEDNVYRVANTATLTSIAAAW